MPLSYIGVLNNNNYNKWTFI